MCVCVCVEGGVKQQRRRDRDSVSDGRWVGSRNRAIVRVTVTGGEGRNRDRVKVEGWREADRKVTKIVTMTEMRE